MDDDAALALLLADHENDGWEPGSPITQQDLGVLEAVLHRPIPPAIRGVLARTGDGMLQGRDARLLFFPTPLLRELNPMPHRAPELAEMFVLGDDEGDFFYFADPSNRLGEGPEAIFAVPKSSPTLVHARLVGRTLLELARRVLAGEPVIDEPLPREGSAGTR